MFGYQEPSYCTTWSDDGRITLRRQCYNVLYLHIIYMSECSDSDGTCKGCGKRDYNVLFFR